MYFAHQMNRNDDIFSGCIEAAHTIIIAECQSIRDAVEEAFMRTCMSACSFMHIFDERTSTGR